MTSTRDTSQPIVQLGSQGAVVHADDARLDALSAQFARQHYVRLPQLVAPNLLDRVLRAVERGPFTERRDGDFAVENRLSSSHVAVITLHLVVNCPSFFEVISHITQCGPIGSFRGRVYRRLARLGHYYDWHSDTDDTRIAAMSLNLGGEYAGGELELRPVDASSGVVIENRHLGDAVVFRVARGFEHRVRLVEGNDVRTVFAGWFRESEELFLRNTQHTETWQHIAHANANMQL